MDFALSESTKDKVPPLLEDILKRTLISEKNDIFLTLVIVMLSENGFLLIDDDTVDLQCWQGIDGKHLSKWKTSTGVYELTCAMDGYSNTKIKFVLCALGSSIIINVVITDIKPEVYSVCFPVSHYIVTPDAPTIPMMFHDLQNLSDTFKNTIITPVKGVILNYYGYSSASFVGLPEEDIFNLLLKLPLFDIINVGKTCKRLNLLINNEGFWHKLFLRDFSQKVGQYNKDTTIEWKRCYREVYTEPEPKPEVPQLEVQHNRISMGTYSWIAIRPIYPRVN